MKKIILSGLIFITIGFIIGDYMFGEKKELLKILNNSDTYYFIQEGVYADKNNLKNNTNKLSQKAIDYIDNKYYVYVGITKDYEVAKKIKSIYDAKHISTYQKEQLISSEEFKANVEQFDLLIKSTNDEDQILTIEEIVLANYEEITKNSSKK